MNLYSFLSTWQTQIEAWLVGPLDARVRRDMHTDVRAACSHSVMATIINFLPIILRRLGATTDQIAYYYAVTSIGLLTTGFSMWLMRRWGMKPVALFFWLLGRGSFLLTAFALDSTTLLIIFTVFWVVEPWPAPAYVKTMEAIYPSHQRGRIMAFVRVALVALTLILTPLAGLVLDRWGYRALLPLAGFSGLGSSLIFFTLMRKIDDTPETPAQAGSSSWGILQADSRMLLYLSGVLLFGLGALIPAPLFSVVQVDQSNLSYTQVAWLGFAQSVFWFLGYLFGGRLLDHLGGIRFLQIIFAINALVILPYIWATQSWMLLPAFIAAGLVIAGADLAIMVSVIELAGPERVSAYWAITSTISGVRGLLGPFVGSALVKFGWPYWAVFLLSAGLTLAGSGMLGLVKRIRHSHTLPLQGQNAEQSPSP
jgi:MFS family permease